MKEQTRRCHTSIHDGFPQRYTKEIGLHSLHAPKEILACNGSTPEPDLISITEEGEILFEIDGVMMFIIPFHAVRLYETILFFGEGKLGIDTACGRYREGKICFLLKDLFGDTVRLELSNPGGELGISTRLED